MKTILLGLGTSSPCGKSVEKVKKIHHCNSYLKVGGGDWEHFSCQILEIKENLGRM